MCRIETNGQFGFNSAVNQQRSAGRIDGSHLRGTGVKVRPAQGECPRSDLGQASFTQDMSPKSRVLVVRTGRQRVVPQLYSRAQRTPEQHLTETGLLRVSPVTGNHKPQEGSGQRAEANVL